jgi:ATP-dependent Clp protease protease subunit
MNRYLFLFSPIYDTTAQGMITQILNLDKESNEEITIFINSPGGSVTAMFAILDVMDIVKSPIRTIVIGMAASAAAVIASTGDKRLITENSRFMLHEIWTITGGSLSDIEDSVKQMTKEQEKLLKILSRSTGKGAEEIKKMIKKKDKYFDSKEAVRFGLADEIITSKNATVMKLSESVTSVAFEISGTDDAIKEVQLLRAGVYEHPEYGQLDISVDVLNALKTNFDKNIRGIEIPLDYTHDNEKGEKLAAGWIKNLFVKANEDGLGLFAAVEFTPTGKKLVEQKEYKYSSADFVVDYVTEDGTHVPYVLRGGTLTNRPFIKGMKPIQLSETKTQQKEIDKMDKEALFAALKNSFNVDVQAMEKSIEKLNAEIAELHSKIEELNKLPSEKDEEIKTLKASLLKITNDRRVVEKKRAFEDLVKEGKVVPAQEESVCSKFETAEEIVSFYKDAPAVINKTPKGHGEEGDQGLTTEEQEIVNQGILTKEEIIGNRTLNK